MEGEGKQALEFRKFRYKATEAMGAVLNFRKALGRLESRSALRTWRPMARALLVL